MSDTIITHETFNIENLFFEEPKQYNMKGGLKFSRIYPKYRYPNGQVDKVYIQTPELFHWRIQRGGCGGCNPPFIFEKERSPAWPL